MKKKIVGILVCTLLITTAALPIAGFIIERNKIEIGCDSATLDNVTIKWNQSDWKSALWYSDCKLGTVLADDFICDDQVPIVAVRWWGVYAGVSNPNLTGDYGPWHISFHLSIGQHPLSIPGEMVEFYTINKAYQFFVGYIGSEAVYCHEAYLPFDFNQWKYSQASPNKGELFIDICKPSNGEPDYWHWCTVGDPHPRAGDYGAWSNQSHTQYWSSCGPDFKVDFAFQLMKPKAREKNNGENLMVQVPRNIAINTPFLNWLQSHPYMFPLIQRLIQRFGLQ